MKKSILLCAAALLPALVCADTKKPADKPAATPPAPGATPSPAAAPAPPAKELSPEEAKKRLSLALGTYFASRQKSQGDEEKIDYAALQKGLTDVLDSKNKSYALGSQFGGQMVHDGIEVTAADVVTAFQAALDGKEPLLTQQEVNDEVQKLQARLRQKADEIKQREAVKYEAEGKEFLDKNRSAEGVKVTASGLQYQELTPPADAAAPKPTAEDTVVCNYRGTLLNGTEFDKSPEGQPRTFSLKSVIKGWTEGIALMPVGSKYRFWIPAALAYGNSPRPGGVIKPGHTLAFDVELVRIEPKTSSPTPGAGQAVSPPIKLERGEKAVATTPPISVEMKDGKPIVRQVTPEQEAEAKRKAAEAAKAKPAKPAEPAK